jgi:hypothetical protein
MQHQDFFDSLLFSVPWATFIRIIFKELSSIGGVQFDQGLFTTTFFIKW